MKKNDKVYYKLQKHLNNQAIGFPATKSRVEIRILKHIFTPEEAELTSHLSYQFETVKSIFEKARTSVQSEHELEIILQRILQKGGIEIKTENGIKYYRCIPLVIGMYEYQQNRLTPEFIKDFNEYTANRAFGIDFISTKLPQMRTIPVKKSLQPKHNVSTFDEIISLLQRSEGPFAIFECICRKKKSLENEPCKVTSRKETCLGIGDMAQIFAEINAGRAISQDEAIAIIEENQKEGLVLQPSNTRDVDFICSCCGCCCGILNMLKTLPKPLSYWAANYYAVIDAGACTGCGNCGSKCQVNAISVSKEQEHAVVCIDRCIGCGVCVSSCPTQSISLEKKTEEKVPPQNKEELVDILMKNKKGKLGKLMVTGKVIFDAVRTGQPHLLK